MTEEVSMTKKTRTNVVVGTSIGAFKSAQHFSDHQVLNSSRGHGFAAEKLNNAIDNGLMKDAKIVGANNLKKGPDRLVDGVYLQTKYCQSAKESVSALFEDGKYAYFNVDGSAMSAEVPRDQFKAAITEMKKHIANGEVKGVTDPEMAHELIKEGHVTYKQALNMAKAGTIESLTYDVSTGAVISGYAFGVSALIAFAHAKWSGKSSEEAFEHALLSGAQVFSVALITHVATQQLSRTAINTSLERSTNFLAASMPRTARNALAKAINPQIGANSIASINTVAKALRSNVITSIVTTTILSTKDLYHFSQNEISGLQCFKNICVTGASVVSGGFGFWAGAALGAPLGPLGVWGFGLLGSFIAGSVGGEGAKQLVDLLGEDDIVKIKEIIEAQYSKVLDDYLVTNEELLSISDRVKKVEWDRTVRSIHASGDWEKTTYKLFEGIIKKVLEDRKVVTVN